MDLLLEAAVVLFLFAPSRASGQAPPLGTASSFAVLAGTTVTSTGLTAVTGDLGVSPGTAVTGFPPGTVTGGTIHSNDAVAMQAQSDVTFAYNALAGLPCGTVLTGQDLGGLTLLPGVYCFASSAQLTGTLTLDAQGNPNSQFILQIGSTLTTATDSIVRVINGGQNCNVYWQVGSSATIGTATALVGSLLAFTSITMTTGASVSGRLLARGGAVTMDTNSVAVCILAPPPTPTPTPTLTPTVTPTSTPTQTPTVTPTLTLTPTPTPTDTPTLTPTLTVTLTPTNTPTQTPTNTPTVTLTPTPTQTLTPTLTVTLTPTNTPAQTPTNTPTVTLTPTPTPTNTPTPTPTPTPTLTPTSTLTATVSPGAATSTPTPTFSPTPSILVTVIPTLDPRGLLVLTVTLAAAGLLLMRRLMRS